MPQVNLTAELVAAQSSVTVTASPSDGGKLLAVDASAYDVTVCVPVSPVRLKWRIGTSGNWSDIEGGECFTVAGPDAANVYLAKASAQSASVVVTVTVQTVGSFMAGRTDARAVTYSESLNGRVELSSAGHVLRPTTTLTQEQYRDSYLIGSTLPDYELDFTQLDALPTGVTATTPSLSSRGAYVSSATNAISIALATVLPSLTASAFSVEVEVEVEVDPAYASSERAAFEFGGTVNNRFIVGLSDQGLSNTLSWSNVSTSPSLDVKSGGSPTTGVPTRYKVTASNSGTSALIAHNNSDVVSLTSLQAISGSLTLTLGGSKSLGSKYLMGWVRSVKIWQSALLAKRLYAASPYSTRDVVCWGDSLTQGSGATPAQMNYPAQLASTLSRMVIGRGVGGETSTQIRTRFFSEPSRTRPLINVIWSGRNNPSVAATVLADIAAMTSRLGHSRFIVMSVINRADGTENAGSAAYNNIVALNTALAAAYPQNYIDIRSLLVAATGGQNDAPAPSATADGLHLTATWYSFVQAKVAEFITGKGW